MSRKGNCIDNSPTESFFSHMKDEIDISECKYLEDVKIYMNKQLKGNLLSLSPYILSHFSFLGENRGGGRTVFPWLYCSVKEAPPQLTFCGVGAGRLRFTCAIYISIHAPRRVYLRK